MLVDNWDYWEAEGGRGMESEGMVKNNRLLHVCDVVCACLSHQAEVLG